MFKFLSAVLAILLILSSAGVPALAQETNDICEEMNNAVNSVIGSGKAKGAVLSIVKNGEIQFCEGYGFADEYSNIAADGERTAFRIGSVSKTFVAVAAQILSQEGLLDMNRDISIYLEPDFPVLSFPVTMEQLLTYSAGFEETVTGMAVFNVSDTEPLAESVRKYIPAQVYKPGEVVSYSNYGIALAAYTIERITGQDFAQYCREQIFLPLDMNRTTFEHMHDVAYVSKPYLPDGRETLEPYMNLYPEGSAVSTAEDMANYMQWLLDDQDTRVLSAKSKEELFSRQFSMSEELEGVGYVWIRKARNNKAYYEKKGETLHFYTRIALYPKNQTGIFLSFNTYLPEHEINAIMKKATDLLYGEAPQAEIGSGKASIDISGCYVNNWSSFKTPEKILRYLVPGKILDIEGTLAEGYYLNGEKLILMGPDTYYSPMGILKFLEIDGKTIIATESAISFSRIPFWQHSGLQALPALLFIIFTLACLLREIILLILKRKKEYTAVFLFCTLLQLLSFCALCLLLYNGITAFSLLSLSLPIKLFGWLILAACGTGIVYTVYVKSKHQLIKLIPAGWNMAGILFCIWMSWLNIL